MLKVRMLGQEEITYGDHPILSGKNKITKSMELLLLLLHRKETGIARSRLADALYGVEEVADAGNSLRVTSHRLRKLLLDAGMPEEDFITIREGVYRWSSREEMDVDVWKFRELIEGAEKETDEVRKAELLKAACQMYRGEFLPKLSGQEWALLAAASYKKMYCDALTWIIECSYVNDGGITEGSVLILQSRATNLYGGSKRVLNRSSTYIQYQVLIAQFLKSCCGIIELVDVCAANAQNNACLRSDSAHSLVVGSVCAIQNRLCVLAYCQSCLSCLNIGTVKYQRLAAVSCLLNQLHISINALICTVGQIQHLNVHTLADTVVINLLSCLKLRVDILVRAADGYCVSRLAYKGLLMTAENGLAAQCVLSLAGTNLDGLHGRSSCL